MGGFFASLKGAVFIAGIAVMSATASAQGAYPDKPINLVVPFPAGGAGDILARLVGSELEGRLGKPVIVQNRPGAGTATAAKEVATSPADGYTLFSSSNSTFVLPHVLKDKLPYDSAKDFEPVAQIADLALVLVTHTNNPIKDVASLVAEAKANPGKLTLASYGGGTISHFAGETFKSAAGINMVHLAYKGSAPAMNDLIGGHIAYHVDTAVATAPQVEAGKVRALAVFSAKRSALLPDVPTFKELGYDGINLSAWLALVLPKGTPADVKAKLATAVEAMMKNEAVTKRMTTLGFEPAYALIADWPGRLAKEQAEMKALAEKAGIKASD
jgi:tripartite-type tricarboxylate transporter receptor subunit TctC